MVKGMDWNPELYLQFVGPRTQPSIDLVRRIEIKNPYSIIDVGCGPGNSTEILKTRWPDAKIIGIDNSPAMIKKAKELYPDLEWQVKDVLLLEEGIQYDVVYSNAVIQWIPDHKSLINKLFAITKNDGALAVQMPLYFDMPVSSLIDKVYSELFPSQPFSLKELTTVNPTNYYFNLLDSLVKKLDIWETTYLHIMESSTGIYEMLRTTGIKPYLERIPKEEDKDRFQKKIIEGLFQIYKQEESGKVIFPFKRMFFIAYK